jgi:aryl-alcohol dehydrogenase-like predicted oxidoreductase
VHDAVREYALIAQQAGITPSGLALAWCRSRWFVPSTIIGATSLAQLKENLQAFSVELPADVLAAVDEVHVRHRNPTLVD